MNHKDILSATDPSGNGEHLDDGALDFDPAKLGDQTAATSNPAAPDPFDPAALRMTPAFVASAGVKKELTEVPVRKPYKHEFVRVHPSEEYRLTTGVIELKGDREVYLVAPALWPAMAAEATFKPKLFITAITRQGVVFLWELTLPPSDGRIDRWSRSMLDAAQQAETKWTRVAANLHLGAYELKLATNSLDDPVWPDKPFREILRIAFRDRLITSLDHPVMRRLEGET
jgi:hypothetical protein